MSTPIQNTKTHKTGENTQFNNVHSIFPTALHTEKFDKNAIAQELKIAQGHWRKQP